MFQLSRRPILTNFKKYTLYSFCLLCVLSFFQLESIWHHKTTAQWPSLLWVTLILSSIVKTFWLEIDRYLPPIPSWPKVSLNETHPVKVITNPAHLTIELSCVLVIIWLLLFIPNLDALNARLLLTGNAQRDNNTFVSGPAFAASMGLTPVVDVRSLYGVGLPIMFTTAIKLTQSEFSYLGQSRILMWCMIIYYFLWYILLRLCVRSWILALGILLFCLQLKVFGPGAGVLNLYGGLNTTPIRFFFDIFFLLCLAGHGLTRSKWWLWSAAMFVGLQMFYVFAPGACIWVAWVVYLAWSQKDKIRQQTLCLTDLIKLICLVLLPIVVFLLGNAICVGHHILTQTFWYHFSEQVRYSNEGMWLFPYFSVLFDNPFHFFVAIAVLLLYLFSITRALVMETKRDTRDIRPGIIIALCAYGIMDYHQFIMISQSTVLFRHATLFVTVLGFWVSFGFNYVNAWQRTLLPWGIILAGVFCLAHNPMTQCYPNILNVSKDPNVDLRLPQTPSINKDSLRYPAKLKLSVNALGEKDEDLRTEKDFPSDAALTHYVHELFDFNKDAALIDSLTSPTERVAIISSHELLLLAQAHRKPFFYIFPLLCPRPMKMRVYPVDELFSQENIDLTLEQIDRQKPPFIFIHKVLLQMFVPGIYTFSSYGTVEIIKHVLKDYMAYKDGYYLTALRRIAP